MDKVRFGIIGRTEEYVNVKQGGQFFPVPQALIALIIFEQF